MLFVEGDLSTFVFFVFTILELSRDRKSCHRSRHVDRRYFKVRELAAEGHLWVEHVDTVENPADILTKTLKIEAYTRHRKRVMNIK